MKDDYGTIQYNSPSFQSLSVAQPSATSIQGQWIQQKHYLLFRA